MADPIFNPVNLREVGAAQTRSQTSPAPPIPGSINPETNLAPDKRIERIQAAMEKVMRKALPSDTRLQIIQDKDTGTYIYRSVDPDTGKVVAQWPSEQLLELRKELQQMNGLLVDKHV